MIRAGIIGGSNPMAGELIRLLINHPDVEIMWVDSARYTGRLVADVHHGLIGETDLRFQPWASDMLDEINVLFIFRHKGQTIEWLEQHELPEKIRIVDLSVDMRDCTVAKKYGFAYGMPELNRKEMVRGAMRAILPHPVSIIAQLALLPMAKMQGLTSDIDVEVAMPEHSEPLDNAAEVGNDIADALRSLQADFDYAVNIKAVVDSDDDRVMSATVEFDTPIDIGEVLHSYDEFYDDHNFTFIVLDQPDHKEVAGTNKCLMLIDKSGQRVRVSVIMDAYIKGAAGTAVHDMNLLFGLHERVGLALKASQY